ncbi:MAG: glycerate kinase [Bacteroides sp.]|nr:glycerate kinase [Bacteroides sp.]
MKRIVIAIDSFKGCLSSTEANAAAAAGVARLFPTCEVITLPVADGGEGMLEVLLSATHGSRIDTEVHDPLMRPLTAGYGLSGDGETAFIEMAAASGLPLVSTELRNPLHTTTYGTGEQMADALRRGCRHFIIGLGGSATNDAGLGMLQALGFRFFTASGKEITEPICGRHLTQIARIDASTALPALSECRFTAACDVRNPFFGSEGAAHIFAPQKGADEASVALLNEGLRNVAQLIRRDLGREIAEVPGAGAAGGMGGGLMAALDCELKPGIELLLTALHFDEQLHGADLVITGEGKADRQTLMGKVPSGILHRARTRGIPTLLIAGRVDDAELLKEAGFQEVTGINPPNLPLEEAMKPEVARENIVQTVERLLTHA